MPSPIFNAMNRQSNAPRMPQQNVMQQFLQFSNQMRGSNPQQMVQNLVNSGKLTPQMYSQIEQMMEQFGFHK